MPLDQGVACRHSNRVNAPVFKSAQVTPVKDSVTVRFEESPRGTQRVMNVEEGMPFALDRFDKDRGRG